MLEQAMQMDYDTMFLKASEKTAFEEKKKQEDENSCFLIDFNLPYLRILVLLILRNFIRSGTTSPQDK
jgi:hypothetical protein